MNVRRSSGVAGVVRRCGAASTGSPRCELLTVEAELFRDEPGVAAYATAAKSFKAIFAAPPQERGLSLDAVMDAVRTDFESGQYYVTGRLSQQCYADDCLFDGPDPDMPVRSLQRYSDALRGLFDPKLSSIELLALEPRADRRFVAHWTLRGALKLPWRPTIPEYRGATVYEVDDDGRKVVPVIGPK